MKIEKENGYIVYNESDMDDNELVIEMVETYERGKGTAGELIREVIKIAKNEGKALTLCAYPQDDSVDLDTLIEIYEHLGFKVDWTDGEAAEMRY
jgi:ribosomal protein S18 acetylase RimI-like enzyme